MISQPASFQSHSFKQLSISYKLANKQKINLLNMNRHQLNIFLSSLGAESYRTNQIMRWIYHHYCDDFDQMKNINKHLRMILKEYAEIRAPEFILEQKSIDGTVKWAAILGGQQVETVYIPENNRATLCISSQIGCALQCSFCSTAQQGFNRNLRVSEIIGQVWRAAKIINLSKNIYKHPITNIVIMGMGEPLLNLTNLVPSIEIMLDHFGFGISKRRITISTSGIAPALKKLSNMLDVKLAISLHAPNDDLRNKIAPINLKYNIKTFLSSVQHYIKNSKANRGLVTVEYVMLKHINDSTKHAYQLVECLRKIPCKINLIPWNSFPGANYNSSSIEQIKRFADILKKCGFITTIRTTRGHDINAACGQLIGNVINRTKFNV